MAHDAPDGMLLQMDGTPPRWHSPSARYHPRTCAPARIRLVSTATLNGPVTPRVLLAPDLMLLSSASNGRQSFWPGLSWVRVFISNARRPSKHDAAKLRFARLTAVRSVCSCRNVGEVERAAAFSSETRPGQWATSHGISPPVLVAATGGDWRLDFPRPRQSWRLAIGVGDLPLKSPASTRASKLPAADCPPVLGHCVHVSSDMVISSFLLHPQVPEDLPREIVEASVSQDQGLEMKPLCRRWACWDDPCQPIPEEPRPSMLFPL